MKITYFVAICVVITLLSIVNTKAQTLTSQQKNKLTTLMISFIEVYNSGDSIEYKNWFVNYVETNVLQKSGMTMTEVGSGAGGGLSTVPDLFNFANALKSNKLLNSETTKLFFGYTVDGTWGLGSVHQKLGSERIFGHGGDYEGVCTDFGMYLNSGYTVIVLSDMDPPFAHFVSDKIKEFIIRK